MMKSNTFTNIVRKMREAKYMIIQKANRRFTVLSIYVYLINAFAPSIIIMNVDFNYKSRILLVHL